MNHAPLPDSYGRLLTYLRVSVTDRCDMRCIYCMAEDMTFLPKAEILSLPELERLCTAFIRHGVRRLRVTGGEPLVRRDVMSFFHEMGKWLHRDTGQPGLDELTLTTNASRLARLPMVFRRRACAASMSVLIRLIPSALPVSPGAATSPARLMASARHGRWGLRCASTPWPWRA